MLVACDDCVLPEGQYLRDLGSVWMAGRQNSRAGEEQAWRGYALTHRTARGVRRLLTKDAVCLRICSINVPSWGTPEAVVVAAPVAQPHPAVW